MRTPTPPEVQLAWHTAALAGENPARFEDEPQVGWYVRRFVKGGPLIPVKIWLSKVLDENGELTEPEEFLCEVNGEIRDAVKTWTYCKAVSREQFRNLVEMHKTDMQMAATNAPIDVSERPMGPDGFVERTV